MPLQILFLAFRSLVSNSYFHIQHLSWISSLHGQLSSWRTPQPLSIIRSHHIYSQDLSHNLESFPAILPPILKPKHLSITFSAALFLLLSSAQSLSQNCQGIPSWNMTGAHRERLSRSYQWQATPFISNAPMELQNIHVYPLRSTSLHTLNCKLREEATYSLIEKTLYNIETLPKNLDQSR